MSNDPMQSILGVLNYYEKVLGDKEKQVFRQTDSAIRRDLMTAWGFPLPPKRLTKDDLEYRRTALAKLPIEKLYSWEIDLEKGFDTLNKSEAQRTPTRSHIRKFYNWCIERQILVDPTQHEQTIKKTPAFNYKQRPKTRHHPCDLTKYALKETELTTTLRQELDDYINYLSQPDVRHRRHKPLRPATCEAHRQALRRLLGWQHQAHNLPLHELSLALLVPPGNLQDLDACQEAAEHFRDLMKDMARFLQQRGNSANSIAKQIANLTRLIQYQYRGQYQDRHGNDIPMMRIARELIDRYENWGADELAPLSIEDKWMELPDFIKQVTMPCFARTEFKTRHKNDRSLPAIANTFQDALLWSFFSLMPPRRPGEWRKCKVVMACKLSDKPKDLQSDEWIWPLPQRQLDDAEWAYSYLTRQYIYLDRETGEKFGPYLRTCPPADRLLERVPLWFKDTPSLAAKSGDSHGHQYVLVMDRKVYRDKYLYDFLEAYLMGYWRDRYGNWTSVGKTLEPPHTGFQFYELRSSIVTDRSYGDSPDESLAFRSAYLFIGREKGQLFRCGDFGGKLARVAYSLSGQFVTPHLLRSIHAVHAIETMGDHAKLLSLADAMGHRLETLEKIYDKRRSDRKTRLIEKTLDQQLDRMCAGLPVQVKTPSQEMGADVAALKTALQRLPMSQRKLLLDELSG